MTLCDKCGSLVDEPVPDIEVRGLTLRGDGVMLHGDKWVKLTRAEASIFALLAKRQRVSRPSLRTVLPHPGDSNVLSVHVHYLRKRLVEVEAPFGIETIAQFGYGLSAADASQCCERVATHC